MATGQDKVASDKSEIVAKLPRACMDETAAVEFFEEMRWGDTGPCCPLCGSTNVYQMRDRQTGERNKRFLWRCKDCLKQYTVRINTVYEDSPIPLRHWVYAFWKACSSKKGVSALQIKRETGLTYKSALFLMHRIRYAMAPRARTPQPKLGGDGQILEADTTFVGGKPRNHGGTPGPKKGFMQDRKMPVFSVVERGGKVRSFATADVTAKNLGRILKEHAHLGSHLMTDSAAVFKYSIGKPFARHDMTDHHRGQYVREGGIHSNTVESSFALLKRGVYGTFHNVSRKHLHRYVAEFDFRWNNRKVDDGERTMIAIRQADRKRLSFRKLVATPKP
jgi:transposase-like protein